MLDKRIIESVKWCTSCNIDTKALVSALYEIILSNINEPNFAVDKHKY
jgi:hypothetical protein